MKQINQYNFLRWFQDIEFVPVNYDPAKGYMRDGERCDYMPLLINGEPLNFYINTTEGLDDIISLGPASTLAVAFEGSLTASAYTVTFTGTPIAGDTVTINFTADLNDIDGTEDYSVSTTVLEGWGIAEIIDDLLEQIIDLGFVTSGTITYEDHDGLRIRAFSECTGETIIEQTAGAPPKLKLVNAVTGQVINADIATLLVDPFVTEDGDNVFTYYASVSISLTPPGVYIFRIGNDTENFLDSSLLFVPPDDYARYSCICRFRHDRYFYGVNYQNLDDFYQQFRLHLNEIDMQYESDKEVYSEISTGKQRTYNNFKKKIRTLEAYYFDAQAHDACEIMFDSEEIYINGRRYTTKGTYKIITNPATKHNKGVAELYEEDFATANRCLTPITGSDLCVGVELPEMELPQGVFGMPYSYSVDITGDQPFRLSDIVEPPGLTWGIIGNTLSLTGIPTTTGDFTASVTVSNCSDNNSDSFSSSVELVYDNSYNVTYTNNLPINISVYYGDNGGSPSSTLVDDVTYPGGDGIEGTDAALPLTNAIVVLDITGTGKHLVSASCNGAGGSFVIGISTTATFTNVNGGVHISFITD